MERGLDPASLPAGRSEWSERASSDPRAAAHLADVDPAEGHEQGGAANPRVVEEGTGPPSVVAVVLLCDGGEMGAGGRGVERSATRREECGGAWWGEEGRVERRLRRQKRWEGGARVSGYIETTVAVKCVG